MERGKMRLDGSEVGSDGMDVMGRDETHCSPVKHDLGSSSWHAAAHPDTAQAMLEASLLMHERIVHGAVRLSLCCEFAGKSVGDASVQQTRLTARPCAEGTGSCPRDLARSLPHRSAPAPVSGRVHHDFALLSSEFLHLELEPPRNTRDQRRPADEDDTTVKLISSAKGRSTHCTVYDGRKTAALKRAVCPGAHEFWSEEGFGDVGSVGEVGRWGWSFISLSLYLSLSIYLSLSLCMS